MSPVIAFGTDHAGFHLKSMLLSALDLLGCKVIDHGTHNTDSTDYPDYAYAVAQSVANKECDMGVLACGSGIGMSIAANRYPDVRAALCTSGLMARLAREHNDANVLILGGRIIGPETAADCLRQFVETRFLGGRHQQRVDKLYFTPPRSA